MNARAFQSLFFFFWPASNLKPVLIHSVGGLRVLDSICVALVHAEARPIELRTFARNFTLTMAVSTHVYKWVTLAYNGLAAHTK